MCAVSAISDYGNNLPIEWWNQKRFLDYQNLIYQARQFDQATGQPDCEDPEKIALLKRIEDRLVAIENKLEDK